jgi:toxin YoeB
VKGINFTENGWADFLYWMEQDKKTLNRIMQLIKDAARNHTSGIGKPVSSAELRSSEGSALPEPLTGSWSGHWSRRIDEKNRFIYRVLNDGSIEIDALRTHYGEK